MSCGKFEIAQVSGGVGRVSSGKASVSLIETLYMGRQAPIKN